jgi:LPXTG-site transpeptidase (sortase) family protein
MPARSMAVGRLAAVVMVLGLVVTGCSRTAAAPGLGEPATVAASPSAADTPAALGRAGRSGPTQHQRYAPAALVLPGGASAPVVTATTVDGQLRVPERVSSVGWWDGGAQIGDPFGSTVIAGHIDSTNQGLGFFARLPALRVGDRVGVRGPKGERATYRVYRIEVVSKAALSTTSSAFDQQGDPRLVLITCTGNFDRAHGGYDSNLVVLAHPV